MRSEQCRDHAWYTEIMPDYLADVPTTMLARNEQAMLHWLARNMDLSGSGCIVDAGCVLGGSTLSLASGLHANLSIGSKDYRIHTYDIFLAPNDVYSLGLIGNDRKPGDTVLDIFSRNLGQYSRHVMVHSGDFIEASPPKRPIDILFIDITKTRQLNSKVILEFFPLLIPGQSIVVQQDHNDHSCPWANATMEYLEKYFEVLCDESSSRLFLYKKRIPWWVLRRAARLSLADEFKSIQRLVGRETAEVSRYFSAMTAAWTVLEKDGAEAAVRYLDSIPLTQPWESQRPYIEDVKSSIGWIGSSKGLQNFHNNYFAESV
jgi:hypothetical protein